MNDVLYYLCRHCVSIIDGWYPYPSTCLAAQCGKSLYQTRKELKKLKEHGYIVSDRYCEICEDSNYLISGYIITDKAIETDEYKKAYYEEEQIINEFIKYNKF